MNDHNYVRAYCTPQTQEFTLTMPADARFLDAGCVANQDMLWFLVNTYHDVVVRHFRRFRASEAIPHTLGAQYLCTIQHGQAAPSLGRHIFEVNPPRSTEA